MRYLYNENDNNLNQSNTSKYSYLEYQFSKQFISSDLSLSAGAVTSHTDSDAEFFGNADLSHDNYATYLQLDKKFGDRLKLSGGVRYEYNKHKNSEIIHSRLTVPEGVNSEGQMITRFGLNYQLGEGTYIRSSVGQGYRFPILIERFLSTEFGGFVVLPNPDLQSERGFTAEVGLKQGFQFGGFRGFIDVVAFNSRYERMMEFTFVSDPILGFKALNIGDTQILGYEISLAGNSKIFGIPVDFYGGYNFINPKYQEFTTELREISSIDENVLKYRTKHSYTFDIQGEYKNFAVGLALQGASHMLAVDQILETFIPDLRAYRNFNNKGYQLFDSRVSYKFENFQLSLHLKNIFNEEYTLRPGLIESPRNLAIRLDFRV